MSQAKMEEDSSPKVELEWIQMKKEFDVQRRGEEESGLEKLKRKFKQNPLVPIGK